MAFCLLAVVLGIAVSGCGGGGSHSAGMRPLAAPVPFFATVRYANVADPYPSSDYAVVDVALRRVLQYNLDSRAGRHSGLGRCSNLDYVSYIHCLNPVAKVLLYQDAFSSVQGNLGNAGLGLPAGEDDTGCSAYATDAGHPSWFVHDNRGGELVTWASASAKTTDVRHLMDVGNPDYQRACVGQIVGTLRRYGFDGVFLDDDSWWGYYTWYDSLTGQQAWSAKHGQNGYGVPRYGQNCAVEAQCVWLSSIARFNDYVAPRIRAATARTGRDFLVIANTVEANPGSDYQAVLAPLDGFMEESWTDGGLGLAQWRYWWASKAKIAAWAAAHHKYELFHSWNTTETGNTFGLAAMLLFTRGKASYSTSNASYSGRDAWYPEYDSAEELGPPAGPFTTSGPFSDCTRTPGVYYERRFAHGLVLVNPCSSPIGDVPLGGAYSGSGNEPRNVSSVMLAPSTAYILIRSGGGSPLPPRVPAVSLSATSPTISRGATTTLSWRSTGASACAAPWSTSTSPAGAWKVAPLVSTLYAITCNASTGLATVGSVLVSVEGTPPPSPSLTVTASPAAVELGYPSTVSWRSADTAACRLTGPNHRSTPGGVSGSRSVTPDVTSTYTVICTGAGRAASARTTVAVTQSPPVVVVGAKANPPLPVIGEITLQARAPAGATVLYRFDGRVLKSATLHTDYFPAGLYWAEADVTSAGGKVVVLRRALNVIAP